MNKFLKKLKIKRRAISTLARMHVFGNPSRKLKIVGVTGTNGKTTTVTLLYKVATALGYKAGLIGTVENIIGLDIFPHDEKSPATTPDPIYLNKILNKMVKEKCGYVFMEVSSHALDQGRVAGVKFVGGIFTNLTHDHLDYHKNIENYFGAKKKFFKLLSHDAFALANADDDYGNRMLEHIKAKKYLYGFKNSYTSSPTPGVGEKEFHGEIKKLDFNGLELDFNGEVVKTKLLGKFNAYNILSVWSAAKLLGFDMMKVNKILEDIKPPKGRFDYFISKSGVCVVVDYAHTPDALEKILSSVQDIKSSSSKVISVFGCGGDRDPLKRPKMGKIGVDLSDVAIFTSDNPRSEDADKIINEMKTGLNNEELKKVIANSNRREAIARSIEIAKEGDIIVCAGKGHENYQEIKGVKSHFDDLEEYKNILK